MILKNNTASAVAIKDVGNQIVPASSTLTIEIEHKHRYARSNDVVVLLEDGTLTVNDGYNDLTASDGIDALRGYFQKFQETPDQRALFASNRIPAGYTIYPTREGSHEANGTHQGGEQLRFTADGTKTFQFVRHWYAVGGRGVFYNCTPAVNVKAWLYAPPTTGTSNPGAGAYDKVELIPASGLHIFVPNGTNQGDWDIDLTEKMNANVDYTKAVPVKNSTYTGFFDYDYKTDTLTVNAQQEGEYDLYDTQIVMFEFAHDIGGLKDGEMALDVDNVVGKIQLPHWKIKFKVGGLQAGEELSIIMIMAVKGNIDNPFATPW